MTVQIETYRHDEVIDDLEVEVETTKRQELVESLGFNPRFQCVDELAVEPSRFYPELEGLELEYWTLFHDGYYSKNKEEWGIYAFDRVPTSVLEEISTAASLEVFHDIELWTPADKDLDPMAVGVVGQRIGDLRQAWSVGQNAAFNQNARFFPIVRWGESLLPFDGIKDEVSRKMTTISPNIAEPLTAPVWAYVTKLIAENPRRRVYVQKASWLEKHCHERMYRISGTPVCKVCGVTS